MNDYKPNQVTTYGKKYDSFSSEDYTSPAQTKGIQTMSKYFITKNLERCSLSVARCELNNLIDCTSKGLAIGVSHLGGESRHSVVTIHKTAPDERYSVVVMNVRINWDDSSVSQQFKKAILAARKVICEHNKLLKLSPHPLKTSSSHQPAALTA